MMSMNYARLLTFTENMKVKNYKTLLYPKLSDSHISKLLYSKMSNLILILRGIQSVNA